MAEFCWNSRSLERGLMHIVEFDRCGNRTGRALCGMEVDRSCNLPLSQDICDECQKVLAKVLEPDARPSRMGVKP